MNNTKNNNYAGEENVIDENCFEWLQEIVWDVEEVTTLLSNIRKRIIHTLCKKKKIN